MNDNVLKQVGHNVKYLRIMHGYTQEEVSDMLHMSRSTYALLERGSRGLTLEFLLRFCRLFKIKLNTLVELDARIFFRDISLSSRIDKDLDTIINAYYRMSSHARGRLLERIQILLEEDQLNDKFLTDLPDPGFLHEKL